MIHSDNYSNGWSLRELNEMCERIIVGLAMGITKHYADSGTQLVRNQNITPNRFDYSDILYLTDDFAETQKRKRLQANDVITVRTGAKIGDTCVVPPEFAGALTFTTLVATPMPNVLYPQYLSLYINSAQGRSEVNRLMAGGGKGNLNATELKRFRVLTPPHEEQVKIAAILSTWDRAIELTEKLIAAKQKRKQALMQQLLTGRMRLTGFKKGWVEYKLGDLFAERKEIGHDSLPLLSITSTRGVIPRNDVERKDTSTANKSKYKRIAVGDIGYNTMRMWQGVSALSNLEGIVSPAYTIVMPGKRIDGLFASFLFKFTPVVHLFYRYSQGLVSDTWNLKFPHFSQVKVTIPEIAEQREIASVLSCCDKEIELLFSVRCALEHQKRGLMQQLLTGKTRVTVDEEVCVNE